MQIHNNYIPKTLEKSNTAIQISNNLNALERKYFNNIIYFLHKQSINQNINTDCIKIPIIEFTRLSKSDISHKRVEKNLNSLLTKIIKWVKPSEDKFHNSTYISEHELENKILKISLARKVHEILSMDYCKEHGYTKLNLNLVNDFKSTHTMALYEILRSRTFANNKATFDLQSIQEMLTAAKEKQGFKSTYYDNYARFNDKVLKKAVDAINSHEYSDINVTYKPIKDTSNKVVKIDFFVNKKPKNINDKNDEDNKNLDEKSDKNNQEFINNIFKHVEQPQLNQQKEQNNKFKNFTDVIYDVINPIKQTKSKISSDYIDDELFNKITYFGIRPNTLKSKINNENKHIVQNLFDYVRKKYNEKEIQIKIFMKMLINNIDPYAKSPEKIAHEEKKQQEFIKNQKIIAKQKQDEKIEIEKNEILFQENMQQKLQYLKNLSLTNEKAQEIFNNYSIKYDNIIKKLKIDTNIIIDITKDDLNISHERLRGCFLDFLYDSNENIKNHLRKYLEENSIKEVEKINKIKEENKENEKKSLINITVKSREYLKTISKEMLDKIVISYNDYLKSISEDTFKIFKLNLNDIDVNKDNLNINELLKIPFINFISKQI